jgi:hypothetical protein
MWCEEILILGTRQASWQAFNSNDKDEVVSRKLIQIVFFHDSAIALAQRFIAGHILLVDGTFNTNDRRLPLLVLVGKLNSGVSFPVAFSYCPAEDADLYTFFFECLRAKFLRCARRS